MGVGLARSLTERDARVVEVNRPNRQNRRRRGKSDTVDAEAAARAVLAGDATVTPKTGTGPIEALRQLRVARGGAMKARTAAAKPNCTVSSTPHPTRSVANSVRCHSRRRSRSLRAGIPGSPPLPREPRVTALASVARRWRDLAIEITEHDTRIKVILNDIGGPATRRARCRARHRRPTPRHRRRQPRPTPSRTLLRHALRIVTSPGLVGKTNRHRLNRGGDRHANSALWRIVIVRMTSHPNQGLHRPANRRRPQQTRDHPLPQALRRSGALPPPAASHHRPPTRGPPLVQRAA